MNKEDLIDLGFKPIPHFTIGGSLIYELARRRHISVSSIGTANESAWLCEVDRDDNRVITDLICIHNFDYDGLLCKDRLSLFISALGKP